MPIDLTHKPLHIEDLTRRELLSSALAAVLVIACGDDEDAPAPEETTRTIDDFFGPVTVPATPQRVIAGAGYILGNMMALGVTPAGVIGIDSELRARFPGRLDSVVNLVGADGIDMERALSLNPDLAILPVLPGNTGSEDIYRRFKAAMTTFAYEYGYTYIEETLHGLNEVARVLDREERAKEVIAEYESRVADLSRRIVAAGLADKPVSVVRLSQGSNYSIRFGTAESIAFRALGIAQPEGQRNPEDFRIVLSLENLNLLNQAHTVFVYVDANAGNEWETLTQNPVWQSLEPVKNNRAHRVDTGVWFSSDLPGLMSIFDDIEHTFIKPAEQL